jgi:hypothetical protein
MDIAHTQNRGDRSDLLHRPKGVERHTSSWSCPRADLIGIGKLASLRSAISRDQAVRVDDGSIG